MNGFDLYERFFQAPPELIVEWHDRETDAAGWLAIDSLRGHAAGGGTRMLRMPAEQARDTAVMLAKKMAVKFTVAGPAIGGAKSVISFDPDSPDKEGVLRRWFAAIAPYLRNHYGTGSDVNTTEAEVTDLLEDEIQVHHPQEGIVRGHYGEGAVEQAVGQLQRGVGMEVDVPGFGTVEAGDLVTGYGSVRALAHYYAARGESLAGKRVLLQGFGNVGAAAAHYLDQEGARVVGITTGRRREGAGEFQLAHAEDGLDVAAELTAPGRPRGVLHPERWPWQPAPPGAFWDLAADAFLPAAVSDIVTRDHLDRLQQAGVRVISCGANGPFHGSSKGKTSTAQYADDHFAVLPDFIANCGAARLFAYLMQTTPEVAAAVRDGDTDAFLADVDQTVGHALAEVFDGEAPETELLDRAYRTFIPRI